MAVSKKPKPESFGHGPTLRNKAPLDPEAESATLFTICGGLAEQAALHAAPPQHNLI
jgi:hypothetical protein